MSNLSLTVLCGLCLLTGTGAGDVTAMTVNVTCPQGAIALGDPVYVTVEVGLSEPFPVEGLGQPLGTLDLGGWVHEIRAGEMSPVRRLPVTHRLRLDRQDDRGLAYSTSLELLFHVSAERGEVLFPQPGNYWYRLAGPEGVVSNWMALTVLPSEAGAKALSLLTGSDVVEFLLSGHKKTSTAVQQLEKVSTQTPGTTLARMAAARLGLDTADGFHQQHPSFTKARALYRKGQLTDAALDRAVRFLKQAVELPTASPLRPQVLERLSQLEYIRGNFSAAESLLDDAAQKHTRSRIGKRVVQAKQELHQLRDLEQVDVPR